MFFDAPYQIYDDRYIDLKFYSTFAAISAYRKYIQQIELTEPDNVYNLNRLRESIKFIYEKCKNNNLSSIQDYLTLQTGIYPDFLVDLKKDKITFYSLVALNLLERNNWCVNVFSLRDKNIQFMLPGEKEIDLLMEKHFLVQSTICLLDQSC